MYGRHKLFVVAFLGNVDCKSGFCRHEFTFLLQKDNQFFSVHVAGRTSIKTLFRSKLTDNSFYVSSG